MEQPWLDIAVASLGGAIAGTIAWRLSCFLLGAWGVPDAWAAARSAAKGEPAARLELSEAGQGARPSIRFGWRPIHVPVRSPTVVFTHHVLVLVLLLTIAGGVTRILGIGAPSGIHDALAFIIALPAMILMDRVCRGVIATTAKHYEASFARGFERRFPLREFRTALVVDALEDLLQAMPGAPGGELVTSKRTFSNSSSRKPEMRICSGSMSPACREVWRASLDRPSMTSRRSSSSTSVFRRCAGFWRRKATRPCNWATTRSGHMERRWQPGTRCVAYPYCLSSLAPNT